MAAGGPVTNDIFKCALRPIGFIDYAVAFTAEEQQRLRNVFAQGVCDWSAPGVEQRAFLGPWQSFGESGNGDR